MCKEKYTLLDDAVKHNDWGVCYIDRVTLKDDNFCDRICVKTEQAVCEILNVFEALKIKKENDIEEQRIIGIIKTRLGQQLEKIEQDTKLKKSKKKTKNKKHKRAGSSSFKSQNCKR